MFQPGAASALQKRKIYDFNVILQKRMILMIFSVNYSISVELCDLLPSGAPADQKHLNLLCIITVS